MTLLLEFWQGFQAYSWHILFASTICLAFELLLPTNTYTWSSRIRGFFFWLAYIIATVSFFTVFNRFWGSLGLHPLIDINLAWLSASSNEILKVAGTLVAAIVALITGEFFYYWFHRLQHTSAFLWRFHAVHHSIREMSAWNSYHHFTEEIFRIPIILLPLSVLIQAVPGYVPAMVYTILSLQGQFEHSATRFHLGFLRYVIADNKYHRIHHSLDPQHWNKNFGSGTSVWDSVFGTAHFPKPNEWPDVGLAELAEPKTLGEFLWEPFRKGYTTLPIKA